MKQTLFFLLRLMVALLIMLGARQARAATEITAYVWVTNTPAGLSSNIVVNIGAADTRYWTNDATAAPSVNIQITNSTAASATNLYLHLNSYPVYSAGAGTPQLAVYQNTTNTSVLNLVAPNNTNITVTFGGLWARVWYVTNTYADGVPILNRTNSMSAAARTNAENAIINLLAVNRPTNVIPINATFLRNYADTNTAQTLGNKTLVGPVLSGGQWTTITNLTGTNVALTNVTMFLLTVTNGTLDYVRLTNVIGLNGTVHRLTNGYWTNGVFDKPITTNLINYGNAIRSEGSGGNSFQAGSNATASGSMSMAIGNGSVSSGVNSLALGIDALATNDAGIAIGKGARTVGGSSVIAGENAIGYYESVSIGAGTEGGPAGVAIGAGAITQSTNAVAIGAASGATNVGSVAIGFAAVSEHTNSTAIGPGATTTAAYQVRLGTAAETVSIPGMLQAVSQTNSVLRGTNTLNGRLDLVPRANSALANGYNSDVVLGTNVYLRLSGPSAAWTNVGFRAASAVDGTFHVVQADNPGLSFTILDNSGLDATAANRIMTGTGALKNSTNNPVLFKVIYDGSASRWRVFDWPPN